MPQLETDTDIISHDIQDDVDTVRDYLTARGEWLPEGVLDAFNRLEKTAQELEKTAWTQNFWKETAEDLLREKALMPYIAEILSGQLSENNDPA
jgi:hypothetical protein